MLRDAGLGVELAPTACAGDATVLARAAAAGSQELVIVCGGDGTINEVINGLAPSEIPLGILPGGTANILARELRLPISPVTAARRLAHWSPRRIALGRARWTTGVAPHAARNSVPGDSRYYATVAGIGFDAQIVYKLSPELKMGWGVAGYVLEAFRQLVLYDFPRFACRVDGQERPATFATVHRTRLYAGWLHMAPIAGLFQPSLAVCSFRSSSRPRYLLYALAVLTRQHLKLSDVMLEQATTVHCTPPQGSEPIRFELDGELAGILPAMFELVPDALTLLVP